MLSSTVKLVRSDLFKMFCCLRILSKDLFKGQMDLLLALLVVVVLPCVAVVGAFILESNAKSVADLVTLLRGAIIATIGISSRRLMLQ